ncbi:50S ribosomal protein L19, partial [candidate division WOR-3 bacterium]|nr:50S ribosomal protein L19 [candidate division WOR-3 bacterium]
MAKLNTDKIQKEFEKQYLREKPLDFVVGDTVDISYKITEGEKSRIQKFRG